MILSCEFFIIPFLVPASYEWYFCEYDIRIYSTNRIDINLPSKNWGLRKTLYTTCSTIRMYLYDDSFLLMGSFNFDFLIKLYTSTQRTKSDHLFSSYLGYKFLHRSCNKPDTNRKRKTHWMFECISEARPLKSNLQIRS